MIYDRTRVVSTIEFVIAIRSRYAIAVKRNKNECKQHRVHMRVWGLVIRLFINMSMKQHRRETVKTLRLLMGHARCQNDELINMRLFGT